MNNQSTLSEAELSRLCIVADSLIAVKTRDLLTVLDQADNGQCSPMFSDAISILRPYIIKYKNYLDWVRAETLHYIAGQLLATQGIAQSIGRALEEALLQKGL